MASRGIGIGVHYPSIPSLAYYRGRGYRPEDYPNAARVGVETVTLPLFPAMSDADVAAGLRGAARRIELIGSCGQAIALAVRVQSFHYESMAMQISIRDVPEKVRDELVTRLAARPSADAWLKQVRKRKRATQTRVSAEQILDNRDAERR